VLAGNVLTYDVKVANAAPPRRVDVALTDTLPAWVTFQGYQVSSGTAPARCCRARRTICRAT